MVRHIDNGAQSLLLMADSLLAWDS